MKTIFIMFFVLMSPNLFNQQATILAEAVLSVTSGCDPVTITTQPLDQSVSVGNTATFTVVPDGTPPFQYFWHKNGNLIPGANSSSYTTPPVTLSDNGSVFECNLTNCNFTSGITSDQAVLSVDPVTHIAYRNIEVNEFGIYQNFPNPFNPTTIIEYELPSNSNVKLTIFNILGEIVREGVNDYQEKGSYQFIFDGTSLASGIYFYSIIVNSIDGKKNFTTIQKMILAK